MTDASVTASALAAPRSVRIHPDTAFWVAAALFFGWIASFTIDGPLSLAMPNRDLWQHVAVLNALIENPWHPHNPFVDSAESSRSFGPFWLAIAAIARTFGMTAMTALGVAAVLNLTLLAIGIHVFAKSWLRSEWGPLALLFTMSVGGSVLPLAHTGSHSVVTLIEGAAYPAVTMIAASLIHWALVVRVLEGRRVSAAGLAGVVAITAFEVANHQLGAGIALVVAGCLVCFGPARSMRRRAEVIAAMVAGLALSMLWPYHNPLSVVSQIADPRWAATASFYDPAIILFLSIPAIIGVAGFVRPPARGWGLPMLVALGLFALGYLAGASPRVPVGHRFLMPALLLLHIGLAAVVLDQSRALLGPQRKPIARYFVGMALFTAVAHGAGVSQFILSELEYRDRNSDMLADSAAIVANVPQGARIAADDVAAWPITASGRSVLSVPWPEPLIHDLPRRQAANDQLFDTRLPVQRRREIARAWHVSALIVDRRVSRSSLVAQLARENPRHTEIGHLVRFDL